MDVPPEVQLEIRVGALPQSPFRYQDDEVSALVKPYIVNPGSQDFEYVFNPLGHESLAVKWLVKQGDFLNGIAARVNSRRARGSVALQFVLARGGLNIVHGHRRLITRGGQVRAGGWEYAVLGNHQCPNFTSSECTAFYLRPADTPACGGVKKYYIEMPVGKAEYPPQLKPSTDCPYFWSDLIVTSRPRDGYRAAADEDHDSVLWEISRVGQI